ncbi:6-phosphogluconate dehydrogenase (decarboxylating) [Candidatus Kaiserbacteria bacterium RIFCSPHIGHO2_01_FULL_54_36]|uniref:6-phosphogluconate dehydrogenase (Decarboxylating) n=1 Tax=Candidatus Kaiserbacteria bacterium RIFCSPHIGHO2_01_FULL_54_36 TaxID=1798482 RepID=A0A1F6CNS0_9BACT|nr:MAG: 6-phosphogluconate dehydrogenase (decarboxylating) [Candidatus Kaiserbacteria bacterium RIFCSPHIGHO2_01_FULL_54_36]OGG76005.1 MAG: 6-phosphogluconate dehydrogenase (decarboxylating) [Candidatus Kaiserbacteria bacterium RIFCSPLOWO2_01_FULL_54_22]
MASNGVKKEIGIIGLGKMGGNIARRLIEKGWKVSGYDPAEEVMEQLAGEGMTVAGSPLELVDALSTPRLIWVMVPAGKPVDEVLFGPTGIVTKLAGRDTIVDGGNSYYKDSIARSEKLEKLSIRFIDVGCSGGPFSILKSGACLMIGGSEEAFKEDEELFRDLSLKDGYTFFPGAGAGHFVKMIHNGIEYGMMQAIGEGFAILKKSPYLFSLTKVADMYNHGSIIESRLVGWMRSAFEEYGEDLDAISGSVGHSGEGEWTAKTAKELDVPAKIIEESFKFRVASAENPSYIGKLVSALRGQFGGHAIKK